MSIKATAFKDFLTGHIDREQILRLAKEGIKLCSLLETRATVNSLDFKDAICIVNALKNVKVYEEYQTEIDAIVNKGMKLFNCATLNELLYFYGKQINPDDNSLMNIITAPIFFAAQYIACIIMDIEFVITIQLTSRIPRISF